MPFEFPNSPANGEYANGFIWNAANQTWDSAIAPRAATIPISSPNYVINGGFDIWQRGTSGTPSSASNTFVADRWQTYRLGYAAGLTASRQPAGLDGFQYALRLQRTAGNTATDAVFLNQSLETLESVKLAGKTITFSFYARVGSTFSAPSSTITARIHTGTGTDENVRTGFTGGAVIKTENKIVSTSWQRFSITATLGSSITEVAVAFLYEPSGTAGANDYLEITGVQLEEGAAATDFRRNAPSIQAELAACQRYAFFGGASAFGRWGSNTTAELFLVFPVPMRTAPSVTQINSYNVSAIGVTGTQVTSTTLASSTINSAQFNIVAIAGSSGAVAGTTSNGLIFSAEL